jgi:hypothetical protein
MLNSFVLFLLKRDAGNWRSLDYDDKTDSEALSVSLPGVEITATVRSGGGEFSEDSTLQLSRE